MNQELERLAELVERTSGIRLKPNQYAGLAAALRRAAPGIGPAAFLARADDRELVQRLLDEVTVKETTFLRDRGQLESIPWDDLLASARARRDALRIWSAGCATGEEPYTLALLVAERFGDVPTRILGTDLSEAALEAARAGRYRSRAVRELGPAVIDRYFEHEGGWYTVDEKLRASVELRRHNLTVDPAPPPGEAPFDLVLCRNVLIYFDLVTVERVLRSLEDALMPAGTLVVGAADALCGTASRVRAAAPRREARTEPVRRELRRPLGPAPVRDRDAVLAEALGAAGQGARDDAFSLASELLVANPFDADAYFVRGLVELEAGEPVDAVGSLRRALYADPSFGLAAFQLGRACDAVGDAAAARRAYQQALRTLRPDDERHELLLQQVDVEDVAAACHARLAALR